MPAADAIFPKQQAQTALPPVSPVPGRTKRHKQGLKHTLLTAAPACTLEIPQAEVRGGGLERHQVQDAALQLQITGNDACAWRDLVHAETLSVCMTLTCEGDGVTC